MFARAQRGPREMPWIDRVKPKAGLAKPVSSAEDNGPADTTKFPLPDR